MSGAIVPAWQLFLPDCSPLARLAAPGVVLLAGCLAAAAALAAPSSKHGGGTNVQALMRSRELWATIDVCNPPKQPNTIGIRGSMPGDGKTADKMYMSFTLEYLDAVNQWAPLPSSSSGWVLVGGGSSPRQGGWSFTLKPPHTRGKFVLRGVASFRWMHGKPPDRPHDRCRRPPGAMRWWAPNRRATAPPAASL